MKNLFFLFLLPFFVASEAKSQGTTKTSALETGKLAGFTLTGNVQGLPDGEVKVTTPAGDQTVAKGAVKDGAFSIRGAVAEPGLYLLQLSKEKPRPIFLENSSIKISGSKADLPNLKIEGSASQKDFALFEQTFTPVFKNLNAVVTQINNAPEAKKEAMMKQYTDVLQTLQTEMEKFVAQRRSSYVSLFAVAQTMQAAGSITDVERRYNLLNENLKSTTTGKEIASYIAYNKVGAVGTDAIDFTQNDVNDKPVTLSSFRGKYVLVDFWASWCRPCRAENPNVVKAYGHFKNKNFTVLSVSLDQQKDPWMQAIAKDKLDWTHVSDLQFWNNSVAQLYHVQSIPQNFLVDPKGKIVAKDLRGEDLERNCANTWVVTKTTDCTDLKNDWKD